METSKHSKQLDLFPHSYLAEDIPVNHFPRPGSVEARQMTVTSGLKCLESFKNVGQLGYLRKMLVGTLNWASRRCSLTWKVKDTIPRHSILVLWPKTLPIEECDSGLWLTPSTVQIEPTEGRREKRTAYRLSIGRKDYPGCLAEQVATPKMWPTPSAQQAGLGPSMGKLVTKEGAPPEPNQRVYNPETGKHVQVNLNRAVKMWPTPQAFDAQRGPISEERYQKKLGGPSLISEIQHRQKMWPTPRASEWKDTGPVGSKSHTHMDKRDYLCAKVKDPEQPKGSLNPDWTEHYLMGYPYGWTNLTYQELESESRTEPKD